MEPITFVYIGIGLLVGAVVGYVIRHTVISRQAASVEEKIKRQIEEGNVKAKEIILEAQHKSAQILEEIKKEERERKVQADKIEERLIKREELLDKQFTDVREKENQVQGDLQKMGEAKAHIQELKNKINQELERVEITTP